MISDVQVAFRSCGVRQGRQRSDEIRLFSAPRKPVRTRSPHAGGVRPAAFYTRIAVLLLTNALALVGMLMSPDISALINGRSQRVVDAYETRIAQLRLEVDRVHSRQYAEAGDINLQLQDLAQQQEVLLEQHQLVAQLAKRAADLGITSASIAPPAEGPPVAALPDAVAGHTPSDVASLSASIARMQDDGRLALAAITESADKTTSAIVKELGPLGIRPKLPDDADGTGGPYLPPVDGPDADSLLDEANDAYLSLTRFAAARSAMETAPVHMPLASMKRVSSGFGNRTDPFTHGRAFHPGIDYPAPTGTTVFSAGAGTVTFVGQINGYGNAVEVTHASGLVTRYGHLSAFIAKQGQVVDAGTPIARVGSTGRSTGPHLHFEVRRNDKAIDPQPYVSAGRRLAKVFAAGAV
jgi:murein DD-endopeptidase MepM/ murein hydrolase activator NlpD